MAAKKPPVVEVAPPVVPDTEGHAQTAKQLGINPLTPELHEAKENERRVLARITERQQIAKKRSEDEQWELLVSCVEHDLGELAKLYWDHQRPETWSEQAYIFEVLLCVQGHDPIGAEYWFHSAWHRRAYTKQRAEDTGDEARWRVVYPTMTSKYTSDFTRALLLAEVSDQEQKRREEYDKIPL